MQSWCWAGERPLKFPVSVREMSSAPATLVLTASGELLEGGESQRALGSGLFLPWLCKNLSRLAGLPNGQIPVLKFPSWRHQVSDFASGLLNYSLAWA